MTDLITTAQDNPLIIAIVQATMTMVKERAKESESSASSQLPQKESAAVSPPPTQAAASTSQSACSVTAAEPLMSHSQRSKGK